MVDDVAGGVSLLRSSTIGVSMRGSGLSCFVTPHGTATSGTVLFSIAWKDIKAFKTWRSDSEKEIDQEEINAALYFLAHQWSLLL